MDPLDARSYVGRPWHELEDRRAAHWRDRRARLGALDLLAVADGLWREARALHPEWPSPAERDEDLRAHAQLAEEMRRSDPARRG